MKAWLLANWIWVLTVAAPILVSTFIVKWVDFYGDDNPRLKRFFRFVLSLLSLLPARNATGAGVRLLIGGAEVQVPGASWSKRETSQSRAGKRR